MVETSLYKVLITMFNARNQSVFNPRERTTDGKSIYVLRSRLLHSIDCLKVSNENMELG
jgi:hypothetical protein